MKYKCNGNYFMENVKVFSEGDIVTINQSNLYNVTTSVDFKNIPNIDYVVDTYLYPFVTSYTKPSNEESFGELLSQMHDTYIRKNRDYRDSFTKSMDKFGLIASVVRLGDKMNRLENLADGKSPNVKDESIADTLLDLANYAVMTVMWLRNQSERSANDLPSGNSDKYCNGNV